MSATPCTPNFLMASTSLDIFPTTIIPLYDASNRARYGHLLFYVAPHTAGCGCSSGAQVRQCTAKFVLDVAQYFSAESYLLGTWAPRCAFKVAVAVLKFSSQALVQLQHRRPAAPCPSACLAHGNVIPMIRVIHGIFLHCNASERTYHLD